MTSPDIKFSVRIHQHGYSYQELREIWIAADRLGFHSATLYDLLNSPALECWTTLAALAAETGRIRLTPLVLANTYRPPPLLAKMAATLDVISQGRLELGIGTGGDEGDHRASGYTYPSIQTRVEMLEESVDIIKRLWQEPKVSHQGRHYSLNEAAVDPGPVQKPHPPILIGGHGERYLMRAVARHADICNIGFEIGLEEFNAKLNSLEEHCQREGRDLAEIEVSHNTRVIIAENAAQLEDLVSGGAAAANTTLSAYRKSLSRAIAGTPAQCRQQIQRLVDRGITYFFLLFPEPVSVDSLSLFAKEVMPHFVRSADRDLR
ncbi:MAG: hypothetical protein BZY80_04985 [SAR202 cluster bacterium Io17-Chloro-G2]|nr:MAG: hypothetical protein BZY80_04985 [SAR202 cluster bacterium Io17-Chloro-G2]